MEKFYMFKRNLKDDKYVCWEWKIRVNFCLRNENKRGRITVMFGSFYG